VNTLFNEWVTRHNISTEALQELSAVLMSAVPSTAADYGASEASAQQQIRIEAPKHGVRLWRNNVGACVDDRGNYVRYGLANESRAMNNQIKSADLIGITPVTVTPQHVGAVLGVFTSIECKRPGWRYNGAGREQAQLKWSQLVISMGGFAQFATMPGDVWHEKI